MTKSVTVNGKTYAWPSAPIVVICVDGCEPAYLTEAMRGGQMPWLSQMLPHGTDVDGLVKDAWHNRILLARGATFSPRDEVDLHIRFNVVQSQNPRLAAYLTERLTALATARHALHRAAQAST